jgi:carbon-monoxide dehydrogenase medium subunit
LENRVEVRFDYLRPSSIEEAIELLQRHGKGAMLIAGGTDVMVGIRENKFSPQVLISLKGLKGLDYIETYKDGLRIGAMSTHSQLTESLLIRESFTALSDAVDHLGSLQIRNVATIGGNISNALPSADTACPLLVLNAQVKIKGPQEERKLPLEEFFMGPGKTALRSDEILIELDIPSLPPNSGSAYWKVARRKAMELPILGVAMMLSVQVVDSSSMKEAFIKRAALEELLNALDRSEIYCREVRVALGVAAPIPIRSKSAEDTLIGARLTTKRLVEAGIRASNETKARDTMRGAAWYRREMVKVAPKRLAIKCLERILMPKEREE